MTDPPPLLYSEAEIAVLLSRAIELERQLPGPAERSGFSLSELRQIGSEVGIPPHVVDEAASQVGMEKRGLWERLIRTPTRFFDQRTVTGELSPEQVSGLIGVLRRITRRQGAVEDVLGAVEWKTDSEFAPLHVRIHSGRGRTRIEALENRRSESGFALGFVGPGVGTFVGVIVAATTLGPGLASAGLVAGSVALSTGLVWRWWRRTADEARKRMDHLMTHMGAEANRMVHGDRTLASGPVEETSDPAPTQERP